MRFYVTHTLGEHVVVKACESAADVFAVCHAMLCVGESIQQVQKQTHENGMIMNADFHDVIKELNK